MKFDRSYQKNYKNGLWNKKIELLRKNIFHFSLINLICRSFIVNLMNRNPFGMNSVFLDFKEKRAAKLRTLFFLIFGFIHHILFKINLKKFRFRL